MRSAKTLTRLVYYELWDTAPWAVDKKKRRWCDYEPNIIEAYDHKLELEEWKLYRKLYSRCARAACKAYDRFSLPGTGVYTNAQLDLEEATIRKAIESYEIVDC